MRRAFPLLFLAATAAAARPPAPTAAGTVGDRDALRLLADGYTGKVRLHGAWKDAADPSLTHEVCTDSGARPGPRRIAICTRVANADAATPGAVDLLVFEPAATRRDRAQPGAHFKGIASGAGGVPGPVHLMALGPTQTAFVVASPSADRGWTRESTTLYLQQDGRLRPLLGMRSHVDNAGACTPGDDATGRRCRRHAITLTCELRADPARIENGWYPLELRVTGDRGGERIDRTIPVPRDAYGYVLSERTLQTQGCDSGT